MHLNSEIIFQGNELSMSMNESRSSAATKASNINEGKKCGICQKNVKSCDWFNHIRKQHSYIAWRDGEQPLVSLSPIGQDKGPTYITHSIRLG